MVFEVSVDGLKNHLQICLIGFASMEDVARFERDLTLALAQLDRDKRPHQLLYDVSGAKIQSQDVVNALRQLALRSPKTSAFALVNARALAGRQLSRIFLGADAHVCNSREEALRWLDAERERTASSTAINH